MGKQARLRKERKVYGGMSERNRMVTKYAFDNLGEFLAANADNISNREDQLRTVLHWVNASPGNSAVELCATAFLMCSDDGGYGTDRQLKWAREGLCYEFIYGNDAARRLLLHMPIPKDDSDLLHPFEEMPVVSDPDEQAAIRLVQHLLLLRPSAHFVMDVLRAMAFPNNAFPGKDWVRLAFIPIRFLLESEQGDKLWKVIDEKEWASDSDVQANIALLLKWLPYDLYLRSPHWKRVRNAALERAHHRCQVCNAAGRLEVHHRTYDRRGQEQLEDVTVLCRNCHETFHRNGRLTKGDVSALGVGAGGHGL
jgi:hypothetical protein